MTASGMRTVKSRGTVTIDIETCKGCELCITACPPKVLTMTTDTNRAGLHYPQLHPGCTGCAACLFICPDFCFEVFRYDEPVMTDFPSVFVHEGTPGVPE